MAMPDDARHLSAGGGGNGNQHAAHILGLGERGKVRARAAHGNAIDEHAALARIVIDKTAHHMAERRILAHLGQKQRSRRASSINERPILPAGTAARSDFHRHTGGHAHAGGKQHRDQKIDDQDGSRKGNRASGHERHRGNARSDDVGLGYTQQVTGIEVTPHAVSQAKKMEHHDFGEDPHPGPDPQRGQHLARNGEFKAQQEGRDAGDQETAQLSKADGKNISQPAAEDSGEEVGELGQTTHAVSKVQIGRMGH